MLLKKTGFIVGWEWKEDFRAVIYNILYAMFIFCSPKDKKYHRTTLEI